MSARHYITAQEESDMERAEAVVTCDEATNDAHELVRDARKILEKAATRIDRRLGREAAILDLIAQSLGSLEVYLEMNDYSQLDGEESLKIAAAELYKAATPARERLEQWNARKKQLWTTTR